MAREKLLYASKEEAEEARQALRQLDQKRGSTEWAIDRVLDLLAPGAEKSQDRRARASALELARARQAAVWEVLQPFGWEATRVVLQAPRLTLNTNQAGGLIELAKQEH